MHKDKLIKNIKKLGYVEYDLSGCGGRGKNIYYCMYDYLKVSPIDKNKFILCNTVVANYFFINNYGKIIDLVHFSPKELKKNKLLLGRLKEEYNEGGYIKVITNITPLFENADINFIFLVDNILVINKKNHE